MLLRGTTGHVLSQASLLTCLPMLMSHIIHVVMGKVTLPLITVPTGVAVIGANVATPSKEDLRAAWLNRFVH